MWWVFSCGWVGPGAGCWSSWGSCPLGSAPGTRARAWGLGGCVWWVPGSKMGVSNCRVGLIHGTLAYLATAPSIAGVCVTLAGL